MSLENFINPSTVAVKSVQGLIEIVLRGASIVLSLCSIVSAAAYFGMLAQLGDFLARLAGSFNLISFENNITSLPGFIIFASGLVLIYQVVAILQLFLNFKLLHVKIPIRTTFWTLFALIDIATVAVFAFIFFCGSIAAIVLAARDWKTAIELLGTLPEAPEYTKLKGQVNGVYSAAVAISVFAFIKTIIYVGAVVFYLVANVLFNKRTHGMMLVVPPDLEDSHHAQNEMISADH